MAVRKLLPTTPGQRHKIIGTFDTITASAPEKSLVVGGRKSGGRNHDGKMTMRYIGGGHKKKYRVIDFKRNKDGVPATVKTIEYDPNRSARIALLFYADGEKRYILAPNGLQVGQVVLSGAEAAPEVGNSLPLQNIPLGTIIHNVELRPGQGAAMVRSAGTFAQLTSREDKYAIIILPSGGVAMNPVDHPMGGGEGRSSGGHPRSRKGLLAKGYKTRAPKKQSSQYIIERKKK
jgi:large subunit ribosomal protein L2